MEGVGEYGVRMNTMPRYVVSGTLSDEEANWGPTTVLRGDVVDEVTRLRAEATGNLLVHGSGQLVRTLVEHGLVDEYRLMMFPIILGSGKRMYPEALSGEAAKLALADSRVVGDGVLLLTYRPVPSARADGADGAGEAS
jgi:dihydrofolate reductase